MQEKVRRFSNGGSGGTSNANSVVNTICRDCIFASWDKNEQTGCNFNHRIDRFILLGKANLVRELDKYFYKIGRFCNACRNREWAESENGSDLKKVVEKQIEVRIDYIIFGTEGNYEEVRDRVKVTLNSILNQVVKPYSISLINSNKEIESRKFWLDLKHWCGEVKFRVVRPLDDDPVNAAVDKFSGTYYSLWESGEIVPSDYSEKINNAINIQLRPISMITTESGNGTLIQRMVHNAVSGNSDEYDVEEKIKMVAEEFENQPMITSWDKL